jgi:hypothetical protein
MLSIAPESGFIEYKREKRVQRFNFPIMNISNEIKIPKGVWTGAIHVL